MAPATEPDHPPAPSPSGSDHSQSPIDPKQSSKGTHLYEVLGLPRTATDDEIKKAYRRLALRYHPDKNLEGDPAKTEKFKEINQAHAILSNPSKRRVYDEYGEMGLRLVEQFGDDDTIMRLAFRPWFKWLFVVCGLSTCCCFGCCCGCMFCCNCCCNFCFGRCKPHDTPFESGFGFGDESPPSEVVTEQPTDNAHAVPSPQEGRRSPSQGPPPPTEHTPTEPPNYGSIEPTQHQ